MLLRLDGYLTCTTISSFAQTCEAYLRRGIRTVDLDVQRLLTIDVMGLEGLHRLQAMGLRIRVHHASPFIRTLLASGPLEHCIENEA